MIELRRRAEAVAAAEVQRTLRRLHSHRGTNGAGEGAEEQMAQEVERLAQRLVAKLLHAPTVRLKAHAADGEGAVYAEVVEELFGMRG